MKHPLTVYIAALLFMFAFAGCSSDDDGDCQGVDCLPAATQTGEDTFGALIDGEPYIPGGGVNPLDCVYQLVNGERYFTLTSSMNQDDFSLIALVISTNAKSITEGETYPLVSQGDGNATGIYSLNSDLYFTNDVQTGGLTITRLNMSAQIVSGTFFFDVIDGNGDLREIREGRFDMQFTQ